MDYWLSTEDPNIHSHPPLPTTKKTETDLGVVLDIFSTTKPRWSVRPPSLPNTIGYPLISFETHNAHTVYD